MIDKVEEAISAVEITTHDGTYMTTAYRTVGEVAAAIDRGEVIPVHWLRVDGTRFDEDAWFNADFVHMIRSNRS